MRVGTLRLEATLTEGRRAVGSIRGWGAPNGGSITLGLVLVYTNYASSTLAPVGQTACAATRQAPSIISKSRYRGSTWTFTAPLIRPTTDNHSPTSEKCIRLISTWLSREARFMCPRGPQVWSHVAETKQLQAKMADRAERARTKSHRAPPARAVTGPFRTHG
jgi:hypothetical protein